jgi:hypothetical protein
MTNTGKLGNRCGANVVLHVGPMLGTLCTANPTFQPATNVGPIMHVYWDGAFYSKKNSTVENFYSTPTQAAKPQRKFQLSKVANAKYN